MSAYILLQSATPEAVLRLGQTPFRAIKDALIDAYFQQQNHNSLIEYLKGKLQHSTRTAFIQVTFKGSIQEFLKKIEVGWQCKSKNFTKNRGAMAL